MTSINLGSFFQSGGKTVFGGGASNLDTGSLIDDLVSARQISVTRIEDKITANTDKIGSFSELQTILSQFSQAVDFLRSPPGIGQEDQDIFSYRSVSTFTNATQASTFYAGFSASPGTDVGNYDVTIEALAQERIFRSDDILVADLGTSVVEAAATANRFTAGTLDLNNGYSVDLVAGESLNEIVAKINAIKDDSKVQASVIKVSDGTYKLQLKGTETGTDASTDYDVNIAGNTGLGGVLESLNFTQTQDRLQSHITVEGIDIYRDSNVIDDAIEGLSITAKATTGIGETINASIEADTQLVVDAVTNFVNLYNEVRVFEARQNERDESGIPLDTALLAGNSTLRTVVNAIKAEINQTVAGIAGTDPASLSEIGITFTDFAGDAETPEVRNVLSLDTQKLQDAINADYNAVRRVFAFDFQTDNSALFIYERTNAASINEFSLAIDTTAETVQATFDDNGTPKTIDLEYDAFAGGVTIRGVEGTELEGLVLIYSATTDATINVGMTQGIADKLFNAVSELTNQDTGIITQAVDNLSNSNERFNEDIDRLGEQIEKFRQSLLEKFSAMEQAIANVNSLLQSLQAQSDARNNS